LGKWAIEKKTLRYIRSFKKILRKKDIVARYGGDEFTILFPDTNLNTAAEPAAKALYKAKEAGRNRAVSG
jgi:PleD family two-component response regulator